LAYDGLVFNGLLFICGTFKKRKPLLGVLGIGMGRIGHRCDVCQAAQRRAPSNNNKLPGELLPRVRACGSGGHGRAVAQWAVGYYASGALSLACRLLILLTSEQRQQVCRALPLPRFSLEWLRDQRGRGEPHRPLSWGSGSSWGDGDRGWQLQRASVLGMRCIGYWYGPHRASVWRVACAKLPSAGSPVTTTSGAPGELLPRVRACGSGGRERAVAQWAVMFFV
jgi:hypothetical protein